MPQTSQPADLLRSTHPLPAVVNKIQRLQRLETVTYSLDKIVEGERQSPVLPDFLVGDKLLLVVHGLVIAGIDLSQLKPGDVQIQGPAADSSAPAPAPDFVTSLNNTKTRVYSRTATGLLVPEDPNLESEVRAQGPGADWRFGREVSRRPVKMPARQSLPCCWDWDLNK